MIYELSVAKINNKAPTIAFAVQPTTATIIYLTLLPAAIISTPVPDADRVETWLKNI